MDGSTEEIRQRADIVDIVGQYVALRPAGNNRWKACCPFHDEKTPSFYVSRDKGFYNCFGCKASGDVFKFLQQIENLSFPDAKKQLAERYGVVLRASKDLSPEQKEIFDERDRLRKVMAAAAEFFRSQFWGNAGQNARDYALHTRRLSKATVEKFGIGYSLDAWDSLRDHLTKKYGFSPADCAAAGLLVEKKTGDTPLGGIFEGTAASHFYDRYRHRLMFPIWDEGGRAIAFGGRAMEGGQTGNPDAKYINSPEGTLFKKSRTLYAWHIARAEVGKRESVIVTEGYMDAIALHEAGFANTVATLGTALTKEHVALLKRLSPKIVYLCYDGDSAGMQAALRAGPLFSANQLDVRVVGLPKEDDPDTFIRKHGAVGFENALQRAKLMAQYRVEMAIAGYDFSDLASRTEGVKAAAEVIAEVDNPTEKDSYITWLSDKWSVAEGSTDSSRRGWAEAAVRREVDAAARRARPTNTFQSNTFQANGFQAAREQPGQSREEEAQDTNQTLSHAAAGQASGVVKAERALLAAILGNPSWRVGILEQLPPSKWTQEIHHEIAAVLRAWPEGEPINPTGVMEQLSPEAGGLLGALMMADEAQVAAEDRVVQDWIARINGHWARRAEREMLEMMRLKLERAEPISEEERAAYNAALIGTRRKSVVAK